MSTVNHTPLPEGEPVPMNLWGRDHWSTLAYIETKLVNGADDPVVVEFDPRMRQKRRTYRVLLGALPGHRKPNAMV